MQCVFFLEIIPLLRVTWRKRITCVGGCEQEKERNGKSSFCIFGHKLFLRKKKKLYFV